MLAGKWLTTHYVTVLRKSVKWVRRSLGDFFTMAALGKAPYLLVFVPQGPGAESWALLSVLDRGFQQT
jgi:hypothetical protein